MNEELKRLLDELSEMLVTYSEIVVAPDLTPSNLYKVAKDLKELSKGTKVLAQAAEIMTPQ